MPDSYDAWAARHPSAAAELMQLFKPQTASTIEGSEARVQSLLRLEAARLGFSLWRNNSGSFIDKTGRSVRVGLGNDSANLNAIWKSADLIGIGPSGKFVAVEVKKPGWRLTPGDKRAQAQARFLATVEDLGGLGMFCTDPDQYCEAMACLSVA